MQESTFRSLWGVVKYHLSGNGLLNVSELFPELREDVEELLKFGPKQILFATNFGKFTVGSTVFYTGSKWSHLIEKDETVQVVETPLRVALDGDVFVETKGGHILTVKIEDLDK